MLCTHYDEFLYEKPIWLANLSNGLRVYQDDYRADVHPYSAWLRLKAYLKEQNNLFIDSLWLQFRSHIECAVPDRQLGLFFCKKLLAGFAESDIINYYVIGSFAENDKDVLIQEWRVPELLQECVYRQPLTALAEECLIRSKP